MEKLLNGMIWGRDQLLHSDTVIPHFVSPIDFKHVIGVECTESHYFRIARRFSDIVHSVRGR